MKIKPVLVVMSLTAAFALTACGTSSTSSTLPSSSKTTATSG
ncbi:hypothetical protein [Fodinisporobacter ferrooxydans]